MSEKDFFMTGPKPLGSPKTFLEGINALANGRGQAVNVDKLPDGQEKQELGAIVDTFTRGVAQLRDRSRFQNPIINALAEDTWRICNNRIVPCALMPNNPVVEISFVMTGVSKDDLKAAILLPENYPIQFAKDPLYCLGGICFVSSQVRDFYNQRTKQDSSNLIHHRAKMYEAIFLQFVRSLGHLTFNKYQRQVMAEFPNGLVTSLVYQTTEAPPDGNEWACHLPIRPT